jgi:hypothetical protein
VTFFGTEEFEARQLRTLRKVQKRAGLKPLPRYKSMGLPPVNDKKIKKDTK